MLDNNIRSLSETESKSLYTNYELENAFEIRDHIRQHIDEKLVVADLAKTHGINQKLGQLLSFYFKKPFMPITRKKGFMP